jgi:hypothetical protein
MRIERGAAFSGFKKELDQASQCEIAPRSRNWSLLASSASPSRHEPNSAGHGPLRLISALPKAGSGFCALKAAIISYGTATGGARSCRRTRARTSTESLLWARFTPLIRSQWHPVRRLAAQTGAIRHRFAPRGHSSNDYPPIQPCSDHQQSREAVEQIEAFVTLRLR